MSTGDHQPGERELITRIADALGLRVLARGPVPFGDDMAPVHPDLPEWLWTCDQLADGVDFESQHHDWRDIGYKCMAVNLSDCAAMGVQPVAALCALNLAPDVTDDDALELMRGIDECARSFGCVLCGGDTNGWDGGTVVAVTVIGRCPPGLRPVLRSGARVGDGIWLTGPVGGSRLGRHLRPRPRVHESLEIARRLAPSAMIDISDSLAIDLYHILDASGRAAVLEADLFQADGWDVYFVGPEVPEDEMLALVGELRPDALVIFGTEAADVPRARRFVDLIREVGAVPHMNVIVSGGVFNRADGLWREVGADLFVEKADELIRRTQQLGPRDPHKKRTGVVKKRRRKRKGAVRVA